MKEIIILGAAGNCFDILDSIMSKRRESLHCIGFLDDNEALWGTTVFGVPVVGPLSRAASQQGVFFVNGLGSARSYLDKRALLDRTGIARDRFISIIHPSASVSTFSEIGAGSVLLQQVTLSPGARVGDQVMVLPHTLISHDACVGDYSIIAGCACINGGVIIEESCYIGAGCCIRNGVRIGRGSLLGMSSVILYDVPPYSVMVGNPARLLRNARE